MIILGCDNDWTNLIGNGYCDDDLNNPGCFDDGGDCCGANIDTQFCTECFCYEDCVADFELIGNGMCNDEANKAECNFDGGDCCSNLEMVANGFCNDETNTASCFYDGGDCCINVNTDYCSDCSCVGGVIKSPNYPQNYHNSIYLTWLIEVARGELIQITFQSFDVEYQSSCG